MGAAIARPGLRVRPAGDRLQVAKRGRAENHQCRDAPAGLPDRAPARAMNRVYSQAGLRLTEGEEGLRLAAYRDQGGVWTIGYGHTYGVRAGDRCTRAQAVCWLLGDLQAAERAVNCFVRVPLTQGEFD